MKKFLLLIFAITALSSCYVKSTTPDVPPILTLRVFDPAGRPYSYANVDLYNSAEAYKAAKFPVATTSTDRNGIACFHNLNDINYWFDVYDPDYNFDNYNGINWTRYPLQWNVNVTIDVTLQPY